MKIKLVIDYNKEQYIGKTQTVTPPEFEEAKKNIINYLPDENAHLSMLDENNNFHIFPHNVLKNSVITFMTLEYEIEDIQ